MIRAGLLYGLTVALGFLAVALAVGGCYDTTVKTPPCSVNANQEGCLSPIHDSKRPNDGGAR